MKKYLVVLFSLFCFLPIVMNAEVKSMNLVEALKDEGIESDIDYEENDNQTTIYFFRTKGESKSVDFLKYLDSIYARYGKFFKVRSFEVSGNEDNMLLMKNTFDYLRTDVNTTPFIVIGSTYFITYKEDINENIEKAFIEYYQSGSTVDTIDEVLTRYYRNDTLIMTVFLSMIILIPVFIITMIIKNKIENKKNTEN